jgi:phosphatidylserine decarboxylase
LTQQHHGDKQATDTTLLDRLLTLPQYCLPQHLLSVGMHRLMRCRTRWLKNALIRLIIAKFNVDMSEAAEPNIEAYGSFNEFFTRQLRDGIRPIADSALVSPVDGAISQLGPIREGRVIQAKGMTYSVEELLGGDAALAQQFEAGQFATIYLSPRDYHRIHMPLSGTLKRMRYVPGKLFSVSPRTARAVPRLFARNERLVTVFDTEFGPVALILVGAIFVGSMETIWSGKVTPPYGPRIEDFAYQGDSAIRIEKGQEMGRFNMGSTVVLLLPAGAPQWMQNLTAEQAIKLGQAMS